MPNEWRTSVLITRIRETPAVKVEGISKAPRLSTSSASKRWSLSSLKKESLCQFHWFLVTLTVVKGLEPTVSRAHKSQILGTPILTKIIIGKMVQVFSKTSDLPNCKQNRLDSLFAPTSRTIIVITISHTITVSCKDPTRLKILPPESWK